MGDCEQYTVLVSQGFFLPHVRIYLGTCAKYICPRGLSTRKATRVSVHISVFHCSHCLNLRRQGCGPKFDLIPTVACNLSAYRRRRSCRDKALDYPQGHNPWKALRSPHSVPPILTPNTMIPPLLSESSYLSWITVFLLGAAVLYYYTTKTDIPKIRGIPEIPGALPMFVSFQKLSLTLDLVI